MAWTGPEGGVVVQYGDSVVSRFVIVEYQTMAWCRTYCRQAVWNSELWRVEYSIAQGRVAWADLRVGLVQLEAGVHGLRYSNN